MHLMYIATRILEHITKKMSTSMCGSVCSAAFAACLVYTNNIYICANAIFDVTFSQ